MSEPTRRSGVGTTVDDRVSRFESLESAHQYVSVLRELVDESYAAVQDDAEAARAALAERRVQALHVVEHKLNQLRHHLLASLVLMNDLRTLRRLLLGERQGGLNTLSDDE